MHPKVPPSPKKQWRQDEFINFHLIRNWRPSKKDDHIKISQFTKFEPLSVDFNCVEGSQKSEKLEMDLRNSFSELETFVWNLGDLWQVSAWLLCNKT